MFAPGLKLYAASVISAPSSVMLFKPHPAGMPCKPNQLGTGKAAQLEGAIVVDTSAAENTSVDHGANRRHST